MATPRSQAQSRFVLPALSTRVVAPQASRLIPPSLEPGITGPLPLWTPELFPVALLRNLAPELFEVAAKMSIHWRHRTFSATSDFMIAMSFGT